MHQDDSSLPNASVLFGESNDHRHHESFIPEQKAQTIIAPQVPIPTTASPSHFLPTNAPTPYQDAYHAWIPPENVKKVLESTSSSVRQGTYFPDKFNITMPGILYHDELVRLILCFL